MQKNEIHYLKYSTSKTYDSSNKEAYMNEKNGYTELSLIGNITLFM